MLLVERGLAASRERARALVIAGQVRIEGQPATKAGTLVRPDADVTLAGAIAQFGRTSLLQETANVLVQDFARALEARLAPRPETAAPQPAAATASAPEIRAGALGLRALWAWLQGLLRGLLGFDRARRP